jgi:hypothetical protein
MMAQIVGLAAIVLIALVFVAFVVIRSKLRKFIGKVQNTGRPARRIHLQKKTKAVWRDSQKVGALVDPLLARGFKDAGLFEIPEMPELRLQAVVNTQDGAYGAIYEFPKFGVWIDLVYRFADGGALTCTTNTAPALEARPGFPKVRQEQQDSLLLYQRLQSEKPADREIVIIKIEDFVPLFEKAYADEMDWRAAKGASTEEIRVVAQSGTHKDASENTLSLAQKIHEAQQLRNLDESLRERFAAEQNIPETEWKAMQKHVVVIHDRLPADRIRAQFERLSKIAHLELKLPDNTASSTREQFASLNSTLPGGKGFQKLGEVRIDPITADVWRAPERSS